MNVWIINKGNIKLKDISKKLLAYIYFHTKGKKIDFDKIVYGKYGKPYYIDDFFYNISHSKNYICIVVSNSEVGIDIEEDRNFSSNLKERVLTLEELGDSNINLVEYWSIKEAYSKYMGMGLYLHFNEISVSQIKECINLYNLSTDKYYCFVVGEEILDSVNFINIKDLVDNLNI